MESGFLKDKNAEKTSDSRDKKSRRKQKRKLTEESESLVHIPQHKNAGKPSKSRKKKREKNEESNSLLHIPQEIIENILSRLPIKPLCRFKSVSQTWNSWISDLKFNTQSIFSIIESPEGRFFQSITDKGTSSEMFPVPWGDSKSKEYFSNSCNGMLLICIDMSFYLVNPSTHYFTKVLTLNHGCWGESDYDMSIGLYYDATIQDFRAVVVIRNKFLTRDKERYRNSILVVEASLKGKRWNHVDHTFKLDDHITEGPVLVNGRIHWLVNKKLTRFDPVLNVFEELSSFQPPPNHTKDCRIVGIGIQEGCLCVSRILNENNLEILSMKEYGVSASWTPIFSFLKEKLYILCLINLDSFLLTRDGGILTYFRGRNAIYVYKPGENTYKKCRLRMNEKVTCAIPFTQNMDTPTGYFWDQTKHKNFENTEDIERIKKFWEQSDEIRLINYWRRSIRS